MLTEIEISPSDRATCGGCGKQIMKGTPRGVWDVIQLGRTYVSHRYYCYKCTGLILDNELKDKIYRTKELKRNLKKMINENKKPIILMELEEKNG